LPSAAKRGAPIEIEAKAELREKLQFKAHSHRRRERSIVEVAQNFVERLVEIRMGIALWQQPHQSDQMTDAINRVRRGEETCRPQMQTFDRVVAKMFVEPCPPGSTHTISRLQYGLESRSKSTTHESEMAAVVTRHQLEDGARLPVPFDANHDAFIGPMHFGLS